MHFGASIGFQVRLHGTPLRRSVAQAYGKLAVAAPGADYLLAILPTESLPSSPDEAELTQLTAADDEGW
jgi:hypothetical protein